MNMRAHILTLTLGFAAPGSHLSLCPPHHLLSACRRGVHVVKNLSASLLLHVLPYPDESFDSASLHVSCALHEGSVALYADVDGQVKVLSHRQKF